MTDSKQDWRYRLRGDPARWLLDEAANPSVAFWFQRDIVGRPEDAPLLVDLRDKILFSTPVQQLFAAQDDNGFWESATSLDLPRYQATLWSLALLAELGAPRTSRHARAASEFIMQNHLNEDGAFTGLRELSYAGLLVRSLVYFRNGSDRRLTAALDRLAAHAATGDVFALWAFADLRDDKYAPPVRQGLERLLDRLAGGEFSVFGAFPPFEGNDVLLALRVVRLLGRLHDPRVDVIMPQVWERQEEGAHWRLDKSYVGMLPISAMEAEDAGKWATLNVLRAVTE